MGGQASKANDPKACNPPRARMVRCMTQVPLKILNLMQKCKWIWECRGLQEAKGISPKSITEGLASLMQLFCMRAIPDKYLMAQGLFFQQTKMKQTGTPVKMMRMPMPKMRKLNLTNLPYPFLLSMGIITTIRIWLLLQCEILATQSRILFR